MKPIPSPDDHGQATLTGASDTKSAWLASSQLLAKIEEELKQALRKQHGKPVRLDQPEPRRNSIMLWLQNRFRNQGALNKYLIGAMRLQLDLNKQMAQRLDRLEENVGRLRTHPGSDAELGAQEPRHRLTAAGERVYQILRRTEGGDQLSRRRR